MKTLNKFRIKLESLVCSLTAHERLLCDRPRAVGTRVGHGAVMSETAPPTRSPRPAQDRPGGRSAVFSPSWGGCVHRRGGGCSGQGPGCRPEPSALTVEPDCDVVCGWPAGPVSEGRGGTPSPAFIICRLLDHSHSDWREMVPHCGFDLHFSDNE